MFLAFVTFVASLLGGLALTPLARRAACSLGVVDHPDGRRKLHGHPIPLWGGVAVYVALLVGLVMTAGASWPGRLTLLPLAAVVAVAAGAVCVLGCVDDRLDLNPRFKLLLQTVSTFPVVLAGYWVHRIALFGHSIELGWAGVLLTVIWLVGCINAFNLLDGMDGLAATVGILSALTVALVASLGGHAQVALVALALAGALIGFLAYNLPPASIYLGDSGSMVIGLVIGILAFQGSLEVSAGLAISVPVAITTIPILDATLAVARRRLSGRPFDAADRGHIHHRLLARGLTKWQTLGVIGMLCVTTGTAAAAAAALRSDALAWITVGSVVVLLVITRAFGHHELALFKMALAHTAARSVRRLAGPRRAWWPVATQPALSKMPFAQAWDQLVDDVRRWHGRRLELVVLSGSRDTIRKRLWVDPAESSLSCIHWSLTMSFAGPNDQVCHLSVAGTDAGVSQQWALLQLMRLLRSFGERWLRASKAGDLAAFPRAAAPAPCRPSPALRDRHPSQAEREAA